MFKIHHIIILQIYAEQNLILRSNVSNLLKELRIVANNNLITTIRKEVPYTTTMSN